MADQPLINYQLKLQSDPDELAKFRQGGDVAKRSMQAHGITDPAVHKALLGGDETAVIHHLNAEHAAAGPGSTPKNLHGTAWTMQQFVPPTPPTEHEPEEPADPEEEGDKHA